MGLMKRIVTETQMGNPAPMTAHAAREHLGIELVELPPRPDHCTRTRLKPMIDGCGCEFCEAIDGPYMNEEPPEPPVIWGHAPAS